MVEDFFEELELLYHDNSSSTTPLVEASWGPQGRLHWKINHNWSIQPLHHGQPMNFSACPRTYKSFYYCYTQIFPEGHHHEAADRHGTRDGPGRPHAVTLPRGQLLHQDGGRHRRLPPHRIWIQQIKVSVGRMRKFSWWSWLWYVRACKWRLGGLLPREWRKCTLITELTQNPMTGVIIHFIKWV